MRRKMLKKIEITTGTIFYEPQYLCFFRRSQKNPQIDGSDPLLALKDGGLNRGTLQFGMVESAPIQSVHPKWDRPKITVKFNDG